MIECAWDLLADEQSSKAIAAHDTIAGDVDIGPAALYARRHMTYQWFYG